jgi:hypothetical protein
MASTPSPHAPHVPHGGGGGGGGGGAVERKRQATSTSTAAAPTTPPSTGATTATGTNVGSTDFEGDLKKLQSQLSESISGQTKADEKFTTEQHNLLEEYERQATVCPNDLRIFL